MGDFIKITSKDNDIIKLVTQLTKSSKKRYEKGLFVLEGLRLCMDALLNGYLPEKTIISTSALKKYSDEIGELIGNGNVIEITDSLFEKISDTVNPQGILCLFKIPDFINDGVKSSGRYIALENLQDPSNLGAISRTAEAFGLDGIFLMGGCDPYSPKSLRASMGALLRIPVYQTHDLFKEFDKAGLVSYAAVIDKDAQKLGTVSFAPGSVVIIGNEANGIAKETIARCDNRITIPMDGKAESLNAAIAASIIMWEMCK